MKSANPSAPVRRTWAEVGSIRLLWHVGIAVGGVLLARFLGAITQILLTRRMTLDEYGLYTAMYTLLGVPIIVSGLGIDTWLLREASMPETLRIQIQRAFSLRLYATLGCIVVGAVFMWFTPQPGMTISLIIVVGLGLAFEQLLTTAQSALRAQVRNQAASILQVVAAALFVVFLLLWSSHEKTPSLFAAICRLLAGAVGIGMMIWFMRDSLRLLWAPHEFWVLLLRARVFFAADLLAAVTMKADLTMITLWMGTTAAGLYNPALIIINTTFIVPAVAAQVLLPVIVRPTQTRRSVRLIIGMSLLGSLLYGIFWLIALLFGSEWIITEVFHEGYLAAVPLLQVMALIPLMKSINFCSATIMVARNQQLLRTKLQAVGAIANIVGNIVAIPLFGLAGAAWVNVLTEIALLLAYGWGAWATSEQA